MTTTLFAETEIINGVPAHPGTVYPVPPITGHRAKVPVKATWPSKGAAPSAQTASAPAAETAQEAVPFASYPALAQECMPLAPYADLIAAARAGTLPAAIGGKFPGGPSEPADPELREKLNWGVQTPNNAVSVYALDVSLVWRRQEPDRNVPEPYQSRHAETRRYLLESRLRWLAALQERWQAWKDKRAGKVFYTAGYQGKDGAREPSQLFAAAKALNAVIVDIRHAPGEGVECWHRAALRRLFLSRYQHIAELGNRTYRDGGPVNIVSMDAGIKRVLAIVEEHPPRTRPRVPILLCACEVPSRCHRGVIAEALREDGYDVRELDWTMKAQAAA